MFLNLVCDFMAFIKLSFMWKEKESYMVFAQFVWLKHFHLISTEAPTSPTWSGRAEFSVLWVSHLRVNSLGDSRLPVQAYSGCVNHTFVCLGLVGFHEGKLPKCLKYDSSTIISCVLVSADQTCHRVLRHCLVVMAVKDSKLTEADE